MNIKAKYTVVLKTMLDDPLIRPKIDKALSTYPLYQKRSKEEFIPAYIPTREELNAKILNRYKYREIGFETIARFLDELETAMVEIMPRYNLLFLTTDQDFNIIWNVDYKRTIDRNRTGSTEETATGTGKTTSTGEDTQNTTSTAKDTTTTENNVNSNSKQVKSSTPQNEISIPAKSIDSVPYADEVNWGKDNSTSEGSSTSNGQTTATGKTNRSDETNTETGSTTEGNSREDETTQETTKGNFGVVSAQDLIQKYRETIINIEQMIMEDPRIQECFMLVY